MKNLIKLKVFVNFLFEFFFRNVDEEENQKKVRQDYAVRCGVLGLVGFILSVIFILLSLVVLVRFWIFLFPLLLPRRVVAPSS